MKTLRDAAGLELVWTQDRAFGRRFELRAGEDLWGSLRFEKAFGSLATGESADGRWTFKRTGFLRPRVIVRVAGSEKDAAVYEAGWSGGTLRFSDGRALRFENVSFWTGEWAFSRDPAARLVRLRPDLGMMRLAGSLWIEPEGLAEPETPLLAILGWYVILLMSDDSAAAMVAAG